MVRGDLQDQLREIFLSLGKTVVLVTHDLGEAGLFGDTVVLLREGEIVQEGRFQDLLDAPTDSFARSFVTAQRRTHLGEDGS
jgi:osmoprotectant transport system ATP-binding protein